MDNSKDNAHIFRSLSPTVPLDADMVRSLLHEHVFRNKGPLASLRMPSEESIDRIARVLTGVKLNYDNSLFDNARILLGYRLKFDIPAMLKNVIDYISIINATEQYIAKYDPNIDNNREGAAKYAYIQFTQNMENKLQNRYNIEDKVAALNNLRDCLQNFEDYLPRDEKFLAFFQGWRHIASMIALVTQQALERANPGVDIGRAGPIPRFVTAVLPLVLDERPTLENVKKCLKDSAKQNRDKSGA